MICADAKDILEYEVTFLQKHSMFRLITRN